MGDWFGGLCGFLILLLAGTAVIVPFIWLLEQGDKVLKSWNLPEYGRRDFFIGFWGIIVLNLLLYSLSLVIRGDSTPPEVRATISLALPWVNLILLVFFAFYRRWIAQGALALIGFLLAWVILAGGFFFVSCLVLAGVASVFVSCLGG